MQKGHGRIRTLPFVLVILITMLTSATNQVLTSNRPPISLSRPRRSVREENKIGIPRICQTGRQSGGWKSCGRDSKRYLCQRCLRQCPYLSACRKTMFFD